MKKIMPIALATIVSIFFLMTAFTACSARKSFGGGPCMMGYGGGGAEHGEENMEPGDMSSHSGHDQASMSAHSGHGQSSTGSHDGHQQTDMDSHSGHEYDGAIQGQAMNYDQAKILVVDYLSSTGNPNLVLGDIFEETDFFEAEITTRNGDLVDRVRVDKKTGGVRSAYQF